MKHIDRKHLKDDELVHALSVARDFFQSNRRHVNGVAIVIVIVAVVTIGTIMIRGRMAHRGDDLLAQAMVALNARVVPAAASSGDAGLPAAAQIGATGTFPTEDAKLQAALPALQRAADAYPDSPSGITAQYHLAGALAALGRPADAAKAFETVINTAGRDSIFGRMAMLGRADALRRSGQVDQAIATWKDLAARTDSDIPQDAVLMELGRAYREKGQAAEARKTFDTLIEQHPDSPYAAVARSAIETLG